MKIQSHHFFIFLRQLAFIAVILTGITLAVPSGIVRADDAGYALQFDGNTDFVQLAATEDIFGTGWKNTKSVNVWVKPTGTNNCTRPDASSCPVIIGDHPRFWGITIGLIPSGHHAGQNRIWIWNFDGTEDSIGIEYNPDEWVNIALVHDGGVLRAYKNGFERGSIASGTTLQADPTKSILNLGGVVGDDILLYQGQIDEVRLWSIALTATEITANMYQSLVGNEVGLKAYYKMSDGAGTKLTDDGVNTSWDGELMDGSPPRLPKDGTYPLWVTSDAFIAPTPPAAPTNLDATQISAYQIDLTWADNSTNESDFEIERCTGVSCTDFSLLDSVLTGTQAYTDTSVAPATTYCYKVRATNSGGASAYTSVDCATTPDIPPAAPTGLNVTAISANRIDLAWTDNSTNESNFEIERCAGAGCTNFSLLNSVLAGTQTYPDTSVFPNTVFCYRVLATNTAGDSAYTNVDCATTAYVPVYLPISLK